MSCETRTTAWERPRSERIRSLALLWNRKSGWPLHPLVQSLEGYQAAISVDLQGHCGAVEEQSISIQDVPSQQNKRLLRMSKNFNGMWRESVQTQFQTVRREEKDLSAESYDGNLIQRQESQSIHELAGNHGPIGRSVNLGW
jgi:hypothetical protein